MKRIFLLLFCFSFIIILNAETIINDGTVYTADAIWSVANSPYLVNGEVTVATNATLTIEPGVTVKFKTGIHSGYSSPEFDLGFMRINGKLLAEGTETDSITFTRDGEYGYWGILFFENTDFASNIQYCKIEYGRGIYNLIGFDEFLPGLDDFYGSLSFYKTNGVVIERCNISNNGYGIYCLFSSFLLRHNKINENGRGMSCYESSPLIANNHISDNNDCGIYISHHSFPVVANDMITENGADGIYISHNSSPTITNNTISGNAWHSIRCLNNSSPIITNNIIYQSDHGGDYGYCVTANGGSNPTLSYNCVWAVNGKLYSGTFNHPTDINMSPLFVDPENSNYSLLPSSPCINAGYPSILYNNVDGSRNTIGAGGGNGIVPSTPDYSFDYLGIGETEIFPLKIYNCRETGINIEFIALNNDVDFFTETSLETIMSGEHVTIDVSFCPQSSGLKKANLIIQANGDVIDDGVVLFCGESGSRNYFHHQTIHSDTTLSFSGSPYHVRGCLKIETGVHLTIEPGVAIKFATTDMNGNNFEHPSDDIGYMLVEGKLTAVGTETDSIVFTRDEIANEQRHTNGNWGCIILSNADTTSAIQYCKVEHGGNLENLIDDYRFVGALSLHQTDKVTVKNSLFYSNFYGIACYESSPIIANNLIRQNEKGIFCSNSSPMITENIICESNSAGIDCFTYSSPTIKNNLISKNKWYGILSCSTARPSIMSNLLTQNDTGISCSSPLLIANNTIVKNIHGILSYSTPFIINTILWDNYIYVLSKEPKVSYSCIEGGYDGDGNIDNNPQFVDPDNGNYSLIETSPCINAGKPNVNGLNLPATDLNGKPRICGDRIDMGPYEWWFEPPYSLPTQITLANYPNPFNPETTIQFALPQNENVELTIYNVKGQRVKTLLSKHCEAGNHSIIWNGQNDNGENVASGLYFYRLNVNGQMQSVKKMILLK